MSIRKLSTIFGAYSQSCHGLIDHLETRVNPFRKLAKHGSDDDLKGLRSRKMPCDMLVSVEISRESLVMLLKLLRHSTYIHKVTLMSEKLVGFKGKSHSGKKIKILANSYN